MEGITFAEIPGVQTVPVVRRGQTLAHGEFLARSDLPMVFEGLGAGTRASTWDRDFFRHFGDQVVQVRAAWPSERDDRLRGTTVRLRDFIAALDAGEEGVYAAEWYLFKDHPELLDDVVGGFPEYLLDDWLESVPPPLSFSADTRNNVYWGAHRSATPVHYDSFNGCTWNVTLKGTKRWLLFSTREFQVAAPECWAALQAKGILSEQRLFTPDTVRRYLDASPDGFPLVTFYTADVGPGDAIYVPWRWAHQVENIGESIAVSRFYVSTENYEAAVGFFRSTLGLRAALLLRLLIGTSATRALLKRPGVRAWLANGGSAAGLRWVMRAAMRRRGSSTLSSSRGAQRAP